MEKRKIQEEEFFDDLGKEDLKAFTCFREVLNKNCVDVDFIEEKFPHVSAMFDSTIDYLLSGKASLSYIARCRELLQSCGLVFKDDCLYYTEWQQKCVEGIKKYGIDNFMEKFNIYVKDNNSIETTFKDILKTHVSQLNLSTRADNILRRNGIITIKDLITKEPGEVIRFNNMGRTTFDEIKEKIRSLGVDFKPLGMPANVWLDKLEYRHKNNITKKPENLEELLKYTNCDDINDLYLFEVLDYDKFLFRYSYKYGDIIVKIGDIQNYSKDVFKKSMIRYTNYPFFKFDELEECLGKFGIVFPIPFSQMSDEDKQEIEKQNTENKKKSVGFKYYLEKFDELLNLKISDVGFDVRTYRCLDRNGFKTIRDIISCSSDYFLKLRNFGIGSLDNLHKKIDELKKVYGIELELKNNDEIDGETHINNLKKNYINRCRAQIEFNKGNINGENNVKFDSIPEEIRKYYVKLIDEKIKKDMRETPLSEKLKSRILAKQQNGKPTVKNNICPDKIDRLWSKSEMIKLASEDSNVIFALLEEMAEIYKEQGMQDEYKFIQALMDSLANTSGKDF
jgi:DNA-directed RNA polymerase alpha subunit